MKKKTMIIQTSSNLITKRFLKRFYSQDYRVIRSLTLSLSHSFSLFINQWNSLFVVILFVCTDNLLLLLNLSVIHSVEADKRSKYTINLVHKNWYFIFILR